MTQQSERRRQPRYLTNGKPTLALTSQIKIEDHDLNHQCVDISPNGLGILSGHCLSVGQVIEIDLQLNDYVLRVKGLVCNRQQQGCHYRLGISFALVPQQHQNLEQQLSCLNLALSA